MGGINKAEIGDEFEMLKIRSFYKKGTKNATWAVCECKCGNIKDIAVSHLLNHTTKSCGCYRHNRMLYGEAAKNSVIREYKRNAKNRNIEFNLSNNEMVFLLTQNCYYCNSLPSRIVKPASAYGEFICNGIDRLNCNDSYNINNCVTSCKVCNYMKTDMDINSFMSHICRIQSKLSSTQNSL